MPDDVQGVPDVPPDPLFEVDDVVPHHWREQLPGELGLDNYFDVPVVNLGTDLLDSPGAITVAVWQQRFNLLDEFAESHNLKIHEFRRGGALITVGNNARRNRTTSFHYHLRAENEPVSQYVSYHPLDPNTSSFCNVCWGEHPFGTIACTEGIQAGAMPYCEWCLRLSPQLYMDMERVFCGGCAGRCASLVPTERPPAIDLTNVTTSAQLPAPPSSFANLYFDAGRECSAAIHPGSSTCGAHSSGDRAFCFECGNYVDTAFNGVYSSSQGAIVCTGCDVEQAYCSNCEDIYPVTELEDGWCLSCNGPPPPDGSHTEEFDESEKEEADLMIPTIPGRENLRLCGLEIEGAGRARTLINSLFEAELIEYPEMADYHTQTRHGSQATYWSLERDSSVDWELVSPPINLADAEDIRSLRSALRVVRAEIKAGNVSLDLRCGLHIHVGAERVGITHAYHLGQVWGYLEDVIFRLGAAKWPFHRAISNGVHYCNPIPKGAKTKLEFGQQLDDQGSSRYNALSFANYIQGFTRNCSCGAVRYDSWDQCTCELGKCTFEFRVFNTSANMHKIHAYLALCQALVAWATNNDTIDPDGFPAQTFLPALVEGMGEVPRAAHVAEWGPRLRFMFNELPLTEGEKHDLLYCVRNSELGQHLDEAFVDSLSIQEVAIA